MKLEFTKLDDNIFNLYKIILSAIGKRVQSFKYAFSILKFDSDNIDSYGLIN